MRPRLLAITPPAGAVDPSCVDAWRLGWDAPLAVLLRTPGIAAAQALEDRRFGPLRDACAGAGLAVLLSCDASEVEGLAPLLCAEGLAGVQVRADPGLAALRAARGCLGAKAVLGRSCHGPPQPGHELVDYSCVAPIFAVRTAAPVASGSKVPVGPSVLAGWAASPAAWIVALGGIDVAGAEACVAAGAAGVAGISAFFGESGVVAQNVGALRRVVCGAAPSLPP